MCRMYRMYGYDMIVKNQAVTGLNVTVSALDAEKLGLTDVLGTVLVVDTLVVGTVLVVVVVVVVLVGDVVGVVVLVVLVFVVLVLVVVELLLLIG